MQFSRLAMLSTLLGWLNFLPGPLHAAATQPAFTAVYEVSSKGMNLATMTRKLTLTAGGHYVFTSTLEATGVAALIKQVNIRERSEGLLRDHGYQPEHYEITRDAGNKHRRSNVQFDWQSKLATGTTNARSWETPLTGAVLDKLVYQLALMADLRRAHTDLVYEVVDDGKLQRYRLELLGTESLTFGSTVLVTKKVQYLRGDTRRTTLWCAPDFDFQPVQIEYREKDGGITLARLRLTPH
ncbi:MAG: DUF3108 domain-containing protein [Gammaproteobacteria bacterium]|nr:DUF3108 domain-containing protein [Gammaproteobacteria bacterium]